MQLIQVRLDVLAIRDNPLSLLTGQFLRLNTRPQDSAQQQSRSRNGKHSKAYGDDFDLICHRFYYTNKMIASPESLAVASEHLVKHDAILAAVINKAPLPNITPHKNYYQELVESIVSQQLSVKAAATIFKRFLELFENSRFPSPEEIISIDTETLRGVGLSRQKAGYIKDLANKVIDGTVKFNHLDKLSNEEVISELTQIKGVGVWTVHMFLIFCMGRLDVLPVGDLGILNGIKKLYELPEKPDAITVEKIAHSNGWHPYESVACWYVWYSLDNKPM